MYIIPEIMLGYFYWQIFSTIKNKVKFSSRDEKIERKISKTFGLVVLFFSLCWAPLHIAHFVIALYDDMTIQIDYLRVFMVMACFSLVLNPILYAYQMKDFRNVMKRQVRILTCQCFCRKRDEASEISLTSTENKI